MSISTQNSYFGGIKSSTIKGKLNFKVKKNKKRIRFYTDRKFLKHLDSSSKIIR